MRASGLLAATLALGVSAAALAAKVPDLKPMVLTARSGKLSVGKERLICYHKRAPGHGMEVGRIRVSMPGTGGHHVILARPYPGTLEEPGDDARDPGKQPADHDCGPRIAWAMQEAAMESAR